MWVVSFTDHSLYIRENNSTYLLIDDWVGLWDDLDAVEKCGKSSPDFRFCLRLAAYTILDTSLGIFRDLPVWELLIQTRSLEIRFDWLRWIVGYEYELPIYGKFSKTEKLFFPCGLCKAIISGEREESTEIGEWQAVWWRTSRNEGRAQDDDLSPSRWMLLGLYNEWWEIWRTEIMTAE